MVAIASVLRSVIPFGAKDLVWLGLLVQRPESHAVHHQRGIHRHNYGDVPWFDMLLGTYRNPARAPDEAGFFDGASSRIGSLLIGRKLA